MTIVSASMKDVDVIQKLVNQFAREGMMLSLSKNDIYERLFEYLLYKKNDEVLGVCALHPVWEGIAEIRSLAVAGDHQRSGIGKALVEKQIERAREFKFNKLFALTYKEEFFASLGFKLTTLDNLPKKIWTDCLKCLKYPDCDETAMEMEL